MSYTKHCVNITVQQRIKMADRYKKLMRKFWSQSPYRSAAVKRARVEIAAGRYKNGKSKTKVLFQCAHCHKNFELEEVEVDHVQELKLIDWRVPMDENLPELLAWMGTLFCSTDNLQVLCIKCHSFKTAEYGKFRQLGGHLL